ncbi:hypothetical protein Nepgr_000538 [Nepenthes gracilis]|uniref:Uncharacterized protein n=1 Tax=Nepenthes gracilis TaxID=150966 RepID=A0AAD3RWA6_NEPGR|nr:hypothetical protein Nepgr_000538 [Nepenthes gracilis]
MNRFQLSLLLALVLLFSRWQNINGVSSKFTRLTAEIEKQQVFQASAGANFTQGNGDLEAVKRQVPTGSNPLHNKR